MLSARHGGFGYNIFYPTGGIFLTNSTNSQQITIYTDGSAIGNPGPGGYGAVVTQGTRQKKLSAGFRSTTNNRMEMMAVIESLKSLKDRRQVVLYSDSRYVVDAINKGWAKKWRANNWTLGSKGKAKNPDLWKQMFDQLDRHDIDVRWVKAHDGNDGNEMADALAVRAGKGRNLAIDHGYETPNIPQPKLLDMPEPEPPADDAPEMPMKLTHVDESGKAQMVDVGGKADTDREAIARGRVLMQPETLALIESNGFEKGDVLGVARIAGIMGAKNTSQLIPLCHPLALNKVAVDFELDKEASAVNITATARTNGKTGVEMEALTAVTVSALTIYDMCKAVDRAMQIDSVRLARKTGGKSGDIILE
jgi:cyclic pyranopterin phosphate synthase